MITLKTSLVALVCLISSVCFSQYNPETGKFEYTYDQVSEFRKWRESSKQIPTLKLKILEQNRLNSYQDSILLIQKTRITALSAQLDIEEANSNMLKGRLHQANSVIESSKVAVDSLKTDLKKARIGGWLKGGGGIVVGAGAALLVILVN